MGGRGQSTLFAYSFKQKSADHPPHKRFPKKLVIVVVSRERN